ncbi:MAG: undecaprenyl-diphosphate phosphatase, partial [Clostridia bacterium]|nr:undecaprenyl-diphosphate phosphatase [Clostridia bacterium]
GHLVIAQSLLGISGDVLVFDIFVHLGTLVAVFIAFWQDILALLKRPWCRFTLLIIIACIPAALIGLFLDDLIAPLFSSVVAVAIALVITGVLLMISDRFDGRKAIADMTYMDAAAIGLFQGFAIVPGLSRSGSTIFGALLCGLKRADAARFSFIISIPVILGAAGKEIIGSVHAGMDLITLPYFVGSFVAAITGYIAIRVFLKLLAKKQMRFFSYYVWLIAAIVFISRIFM